MLRLLLNEFVLRFGLTIFMFKTVSNWFQNRLGVVPFQCPPPLVATLHILWDFLNSKWKASTAYELHEKKKIWKKLTWLYQHLHLNFVRAVVLLKLICKSWIILLLRWKLQSCSPYFEYSLDTVSRLCFDQKYVVWAFNNCCKEKI